MGFYTIQQAHCVVVERFGKFARVEREGWHFLWPFETFKRLDAWEGRACKDQWLVELSEQQTITMPDEGQRRYPRQHYRLLAHPRSSKSVYETYQLP